MDSDRFDRLAKSLGGAVSRRGALAALVSAGLAGVVGGGEARKKRRGGARGKQGRGAASVSAEATCASPGPSSNMNGCNFNGDDFSGENLSGSKMVGTRFNDATLVGTNLSSSNLKDATFRGADLTCADLSSSTLKNADFRGPAGMDITDLTGADLSSSACGGIRFDAKTVFCRTRLCNGSISDEDCPGGFDPDDFCCGNNECGPGQACQGNACCWTNLAAAVGAAGDGDTIRLCAGELLTRGVLIRKPLTIVGAGSGDDPETDTILDAAGIDRVFLTAFGAGAVEVRDLRVTGGNAGTDSGGGILNQTGSTLRLIGVSVVGNTAGIGGGITNDGTLILGNGSRVEGNTATRFGGTGGGIFNRGAATLEAGSVVTSNTAENGGGVWEASGAVDVANASIVTGNNLNNCRPVGAVPNCTD
jgi:hypothetical protein